MSLSEAPATEWSELPELPLATIAQLLPPTLRDLFAFASVCRSWRSLLRSLSPSLLPSLPPLLLNLSPSPPPPFRTSTTSSSSDLPICSSFLSPDIHSLPFSPSRVPLPSPSSCRFLSFSHGHLLFLPSSDPFQPFLHDVITGSRILLPPLPSDHHRVPYYYATLTAPSSSPSSIFLLFFSKFAFLSCQVSPPAGTAMWTRHHFSPDISFITHVVTFRNRLFGLNDCCRLLELDLSSDQTLNNAVRFVNMLWPPRSPHDIDRWEFGPQLVCSADQIFLVLFFFNRGTNAFFLLPGQRAIEIEVYSLDWRKMEWVQVKRLQDCAIFMDCAGKAPVMCEKPERWGGESNCVYVTVPGYHRWMRCSLDEEKIATRIRPLLFNTRRSSWPSPIWIHPSLLY